MAATENDVPGNPDMVQLLLTIETVSHNHYTAHRKSRLAQTALISAYIAIIETRGTARESFAYEDFQRIYDIYSAAAAYEMECKREMDDMMKYFKEHASPSSDAYTDDIPHVPDIDNDTSSH
jgi:hypothetical protein